MNKIEFGDCREIMKRWAKEGVKVQTCVTSPPYFGLRDYNVDGQIGLEPTPDEYVKEMVDVFRCVKDILADDGTVWLNLGDSYAGSGKGSNPDGTPHSSNIKGKQGTNRGTVTGINKPQKAKSICLKPKDLIGIPWKVAFALQEDGWYLRQDIIWHKPNPMPESVTDRCGRSHEYIFLLSKKRKYYFDYVAIQEESKTGPGVTWEERKKAGATAGNVIVGDGVRNGTQRVVHGKGISSNLTQQDGMRNKRSVWMVNTKPYRGAHFATYPTELITPCILSGTSSAGQCPVCGTPWVRVTDKSTTGWEPQCKCGVGKEPVPQIVFDPFMGSGTTALVAKTFNRHYMGCELNPEYEELQKERIGTPSLNDLF
jgi:DNA modification methylase